MKRAILFLSIILGGRVQIFQMWCHLCVLVNALYHVKGKLFSVCLVFFLNEGVLNFEKLFLFICWDDHAIPPYLLTWCVKVTEFLILNGLCEPLVNHNCLGCITLLIYCWILFLIIFLKTCILTLIRSMIAVLLLCVSE